MAKLLSQGWIGVGHAKMLGAQLQDMSAQMGYISDMRPGGIFPIRNPNTKKWAWLGPGQPRAPRPGHQALMLPKLPQIPEPQHQWAYNCV